MIHIHLENKKELESWYVDIMLKILQKNIKSNQRSASVSELGKYIRNKIAAMSDENLRLLLGLNYYQNGKSIGWIAEYIQFVNFCTLYSDFHKSVSKSSRQHKYHLAEREEYLNNCPLPYRLIIEKRMSKASIKMIRTWSEMDKLIASSNKLLEEMNNELSKYFDYNYIPAKTRKELYKKFNISVCPYCNRQYINSYGDYDTGGYLGDLDHIKPKSLYQLYSMSLWNLIPACKPCNQLFKKSTILQILNPTTRGFDDDVILTLQCHDINSIIGHGDNFDLYWDIVGDVDDKTRLKMMNNINLFRLNDVYNANRSDFRMLLKKKSLLSKAYEKSLLRFNLFSELQIDERLWYGDVFDRKKHQNQMLAKAIYDIIEFN